MMTPSPSHGNQPETTPSIEVPLGDNGTVLPIHPIHQMAVMLNLRCEIWLKNGESRFSIFY